MNLKELKLKLPKKWKELSRSSGENQLFIRLSHISPLSNIDSDKFKDKVISESKNETVIKKGIEIPNVNRPIKDFYKAMEAFIDLGYLKGWDHQKLNKLWKSITKSEMIERHEDSDLNFDLTVIRHQNEKIAKQTLINYALMPTKGFDVQIPGMSQKITMKEYLNSDLAQNILKEYVSEKQLGEMKKAIDQVQKKMPEIKKDLEKKGVSYKISKYLNHEAVIIKNKNNEICQYLRIKNFIITGSLLMLVDNFPSGKTVCDSLTNYSSTPKIEKEGSVITKEFYPEKSNYSKEGYLNKEELEGIIKDLIRVIL